MSRLAASLAVAACLLLAATALGAAGTPDARMASVVAAAKTQRSVHYVSVQKVGNTTVTIVCDAGPTSGIQKLTYATAKKKGHLTVIVAHKTAYLRGDSFTLHDFLGFRATDANRFANKWVVIPHSSHAYAPVAEDVTYGSTVSHLRPTGRLANVGRTKLDGHTVVGVRGTAKVKSGGKAVSTLWVRARGKPLPLAEVTVLPGARITITYTRWNKPVNVRAPGEAAKSGKSNLNVA